jgi:hypothetical protein
VLAAHSSTVTASIRRPTRVHDRRHPRHRAIDPKPGRALLFQHFLLHEGSAVTRGVKYVMRSDVMYRR